MSDTDPQYRFSSGPLRSNIIIELHTHYATNVWSGRPARPEEKVHGIIGLPRFISLMNTLRLDSLADNPYADMWMLQMEERLLAAREEMDFLIAGMQTLFSRIPETMTIKDSVSIQPARFPVFASTPLGFIAVYLLTDFDELVRKVLLAHHMALMTSMEKKAFFIKAGRIISGVLVQAQRYRRIPVSRQDLREGNGRARDAIALAGPVPDDILDGTRRSSYSPPLSQTEAGSAAPAPAERPEVANDEPDLARQGAAESEADEGGDDDVSVV